MGMTVTVSMAVTVTVTMLLISTFMFAFTLCGWRRSIEIPLDFLDLDSEMRNERREDATDLREDDLGLSLRADVNGERADVSAGRECPKVKVRHFQDTFACGRLSHTRVQCHGEMRGRAEKKSFGGRFCDGVSHTH